MTLQLTSWLPEGNELESTVAPLHPSARSSDTRGRRQFASKSSTSMTVRSPLVNATNANVPRKRRGPAPADTKSSGGLLGSSAFVGSQGTPRSRTPVDAFGLARGTSCVAKVKLS